MFLRWHAHSNSSYFKRVPNIPSYKNVSIVYPEMDVITSSGQILALPMRGQIRSTVRWIIDCWAGKWRGPPVMSSPVTNYLGHLEQSLNLSGLWFPQPSVELLVRIGFSSLPRVPAVCEPQCRVPLGISLVQYFVLVSLTACVTLNGSCLVYVSFSWSSSVTWMG